MPVNASCGAPSCTGCGLHIVDKYLLMAAERSWHADCLRCSACSCQLEERCFQRDEKLFCSADFYKRYGIGCAGCGEALMPQDLVRRVQDQCFHVRCFRCAHCAKELCTGDQLYILAGGKFVCRADYHAANSNSNPNPNCSSSSSSNRSMEQLERVESGSGEPCVGEAQDGACKVELERQHSLERERERDRELLDCCGSSSDCGDSDRLDSASASASASAVSGKNSSSNNNNGVGAGTTPGTKRRGPRTTIKAKQLDTLKSAFNTTPKPSRHVREQLAAETGLNMRVIQVWFQNRRSKERRMKQLNAMGLNRRMLFNRGPRRLRALRAGLDSIDPMIAMLADGAPPNIDVSHHLALPPNQNSNQNQNQNASRASAYDYFTPEHAMPPPEYLLGLHAHAQAQAQAQAHAHAHAHNMPLAQQFPEYYAASCNAQVFLENNSIKSEVYSQ